MRRIDKYGFVPWADWDFTLAGYLPIKSRITLRCGKCLADFPNLRVLLKHDETCDGLNWDFERIYQFWQHVGNILKRIHVVHEGEPIAFARWNSYNTSLHRLGLHETYAILPMSGDWNGFTSGEFATYGSVKRR